MIKKIIIIILLIVFMLPISVFSQPSNLTDREVLIQMYEKIIYIENAVKKINSNSMIIDGRVTQIENRVIKNEMNISTFMEKLKELVTRWNTLLGMFAIFILGIFTWMWRSVSYRKNNNKIKQKNN